MSEHKHKMKKRIEELEDKQITILTALNESLNSLWSIHSTDTSGIENLNDARNIAYEKAIEVENFLRIHNAYFLLKKGEY